MGTPSLPKLPEMTPDDFGAWCADVKARHGWTQPRLAQELGCGINQIPRWQKAGAPRYIALACAAIVYRLQPWRPADAAPGEGLPKE